MTAIVSTHSLRLAVLVASASGLAWSQDSAQRDVIQITARDNPPSVRAIAPIDDKNVFFLNQRGQIGVAKFSPGLSQIGWEFYSEVKLNALNSLAAGPNFSVLTASPVEVTQAFDTDGDVELDFFQAVVRDWPGRSEGVTITAGPVADPNGRILFALSPHSPAEGEPARARLVAWHPQAEELVTVTESQLQISTFAVSDEGLLAARLHIPGYAEGYYISLTDLPSFDPENPGAAPESVPFTMPSLLVPAELTRNTEPAQVAFFREADREKLMVTCPEAKQLIEVVPERAGSHWQGSILLRAIAPTAIATVVEMKPGQLLGGGEDGFHPIDMEGKAFRIVRVSLAEDGIVLDFNRPVDRFEAVRSERYSVTAVSLDGGKAPVDATPVIESDGETVILKIGEIAPKTVLRIVCQNVPSESGEALLSSAAFYTVHQR